MLRIVASVLFLSACLQAQSTALRCGRLLDVATGTYRTNATVVVTGGLVESINGPVPAGATVIDLSAGVCLPGLIDSHTHITGDPRNSGYRRLGISVPREALTGARQARTTLLAGFTTLRNVGARGYADVALRDAIQDGDVPGPRLFVSGPSLGITGGHCDSNLLPSEYSFRSAGVADGPWEARAKVREVVKYGADVIKICATGGVLSKGDGVGTPQYTLEEMQAIVAEAHKLERKVAAHAHGAEGIKDAIRAGVDSVEHCSLIDEEGIRLAKEKGTVLNFDIYNDDYILSEGAKNGVLPESIEKEKMVGKLQRENFRKAYLAGATLGFGSDAGVYPHGDNWKQFPYMTEFGMKPIEAIRAATLTNAALMGLTGKAGVVAQGAWADIIALAADPLQDIRALQGVKFVMKTGQVYRNDWGSR
jgi:imidazolonepropionase-like amidohydrolase